MMQPSPVLVMFGDIFDNDQEINTPGVLNQYQRLPRNCAFGLDLPDIERKPGCPIGLKNQGSTCYLNSLLQILFFTPQFRSVIFKIPLFKQTLEQPTSYLDQESKTKFILGFQKLFSEMQLLDARYVGTENLSDAFGWNQGQQGEQHDINESMVVILETLERALYKTEFQGLIRQSFKVIMKKCIKCLGCQHVREKQPEEFFQLLVYTKDRPNLHQGILSLTTPQHVEGLLCEVQNNKQNAEIGYVISSTPSVLIITLGKFDFDYIKMERVKITDSFSFELELEMGQYVEGQEEKVYELFGVLIHRGTAHSGHYFAYIRDTLGEGDWKSNFQEKVEELKRRKEDKEGGVECKSKETDTMDRDSEKLKQPSNKSILTNWYQLNDTLVTPIEPHKISTQFGGSQCAYILFYRAAAASAITKPQPPVYIRHTIQAKNKELNDKREYYNHERQHLILQIDGVPTRIKVSEKLEDLLGMYCGEGSGLVNVQNKNGLPYYPLELGHQSQNLDQTIEKADLVHESKWKTMAHESEEYREIKDLVGLEKVPIHVSVLFQNQMTIINTHSSRSLLELRLTLEETFKVSYEKQVLKLVNELSKEVFLTDTPQNDEMTLQKLKFVDHSQLILNELKQQTHDTSQKEDVQEEKQLDLLSLAVERDDANGMRRYYLNNTMTLQEAFDYLIKSENILDDYKRRLRWTNRNRLFSTDQYSKLLSQFPFEEALIKLRIEKGEIPISGDICVKVRMQSKYQKADTEEYFELIQDPNRTQKELKETVCQKFGLDPAQHKLYRTDWLGDPIRPILKEQRTLFEDSYGLEQRIVLRDLESKVAAELIHLNIHITKTGFPDDCEKGFSFKTEETKTMREIKLELARVPFVQELLGSNDSYLRLRLRELKRDYMFGSVLKSHDKTLKAHNIQESNLVLQVLDHDEQLSEDSVVLVTKVRDSAKRLYLNQQEFIFHSSKVPTLKELKTQLLKWLDLELPPEELRIIKYYFHDLEWVEWSEKSYQKWVAVREKQALARQEQKNKLKEGNKLESQNKLQKNNKHRNNKPKPQPQPHHATITEADNNTQQSLATDTSGVLPPSSTVPLSKQPKTTKPNLQKQGKQKHSRAQPLLKEQADGQNLKRMPFLLKDGDMIAYGFNTQMLPKDDLQTEQDENLKLLQEKEMGKIKGKNRVKENPFALNIDF